MTGEGPARRSSTVVAVAILLSRLAGLARERVTARYLGVSIASDAFRAALRIPNLLQNLLGEGVLSASFVPAYSRLIEQDEEQAGRVAGAVLTLLSVITAGAVLAGVVFARAIVVVLTPGFTGERLDLTVTLTRILFLGTGLLVVSAWCLGVLNSHRRFFLSYVAPVAWNAVIIATVVVVAVRGATEADLATALAWGAVAGSVAQVLVQLPGVVGVARGFRVSFGSRLPEVGAVVRRFGPAVVGRGSVQLGAYFDTILASLLAVGAVSALGYAHILYLLPISLFGMSVAAAELPELSRATESVEAVRARVTDGLARIAFYVTPTTVAYLVAGDLLIAVLLRTGRFGDRATTLVWFVLASYSIGMLAGTSSRLLQSALYALGDTRTPAIASIIRFGLAAAAGALLMLQLDRLRLTAGGIEGWSALPAPIATLPDALRDTESGLRLGAVGLAIPAGLTAWLEQYLLRRRLTPLIGGIAVGGGALGKVVTASLAAGAVAVAIRFAVPDVAPVVETCVAGAPAAFTYVAVTTRLKVAEATSLRKALRVPRRGR